jgi:hypothetical protein
MDASELDHLVQWYASAPCIKHNHLWFKDEETDLILSQRQYYSINVRVSNESTPYIMGLR